MIKHSEFNRLESLIIDDITTHPGTNKEQVIRRMQKYYKARTYIQTTINRLVALGHIKDSPVNGHSSLTCIFLSVA